MWIVIWHHCSSWLLFLSMLQLPQSSIKIRCWDFLVSFLTISLLGRGNIIPPSVFVGEYVNNRVMTLSVFENPCVVHLCKICERSMPPPPDSDFCWAGVHNGVGKCLCCWLYAYEFHISMLHFHTHMESALQFFQTFPITSSYFLIFSFFMFSEFILILDILYEYAWPYTFGMYNMSIEYSKWVWTVSDEIILIWSLLYAFRIKSVWKVSDEITLI